LRNLEYSLLDLQGQSDCIVIVNGNSEKSFKATVVLFESKYNPGRAIAGISSTLRRLLASYGESFTLTLKAR